MFAHVQDLQQIAIALNKEVNESINKIVEKAKEDGIVDIYNSKYARDIRTLQEFLSVTNVLNSFFAKAYEVLELAKEKTGDEN